MVQYARSMQNATNANARNSKRGSRDNAIRHAASMNREVYASDKRGRA
jgi:hypothetical protein